MWQPLESFLALPQLFSSQDCTKLLPLQPRCWPQRGFCSLDLNSQPSQDSLAFQCPPSTPQQCLTFTSVSKLAQVSHAATFYSVPSLALVPAGCWLTRVTILIWRPSCVQRSLPGGCVLVCSSCRTPFSRNSPTVTPPWWLSLQQNDSCYLSALSNLGLGTFQLVVYTIAGW